MKFLIGLTYSAVGAILSALMVTAVAGCGSKSSNSNTRAAAYPGAYDRYGDGYAGGDGYVEDGEYVVDGEGAYVEGRDGEVIVDGDSEVDGDFDPYTAFDDDMGEWSEIDGQRFWQPDLTGFENEDEWQPYQDGSWDRDENDGLTWRSNEPWGAVTDHYGVWRHHSTRGWIWMPFPDRKYRPHTATWFDEGDYVGWYPYYSGYKQAYRFNAAQGFDDGYWNGTNAVSAGINTGSFRLGFTVVNRDSVGGDIYGARIQDQAFVNRVAFRAHGEDRIRRGRVGYYPGGNAANAVNFLGIGIGAGRIRVGIPGAARARWNLWRDRHGGDEDVVVRRRVVRRRVVRTGGGAAVAAADVDAAPVRVRRKADVVVGDDDDDQFKPRVVVDKKDEFPPAPKPVKKKTTTQKKKKTSDTATAPSTSADKAADDSQIPDLPDPVKTPGGSNKAQDDVVAPAAAAKPVVVAEKPAYSGKAKDDVSGAAVVPTAAVKPVAKVNKAKDDLVTKQSADTLDELIPRGQREKN